MGYRYVKLKLIERLQIGFARILQTEASWQRYSIFLAEPYALSLTHTCGALSVGSTHALLLMSRVVIHLADSARQRSFYLLRYGASSA